MDKIACPPAKDDDITDPADCAPLALAPALDLLSVNELAEALSTRRGTAVTVDAGKVEHLGGLCLQVLLAASKQWAADNVPFTFSDVSDAFRHDLTLLGGTSKLDLPQE